MKKQTKPSPSSHAFLQRQSILSGLLIFAAGTLFLYSFTQIDLSLTFSRLVALKQIEMTFQYLGYFNRPLSTLIYLLLLLLFFVLYFILLRNWERLKQWPIWKVLLVISAILMLSYNAFSYDLFNYMFDAKIITHYHQNPYVHKALDFPKDPMLSFMRWTHRIYPYGPIWLVLTVPLSFLGLGLLLPTFYLFKFLMAASFVGTVYFLSKILRLVAPERERVGMLFFAFNPLVLYECLVSAHNDIVMLFFAVVSLYLLIQKKYSLAILLLMISIGIKFATVFLLPVFLYVWIFERTGKKIVWEHIFWASMVFMLGAVAVASFRTTFQPWYLLYALPFAALLAHRATITIPATILSFTALLTYVPYLYTGNWDPPIPFILSIVYVTGMIVAALATGVWILWNRRGVSS